MSLKALIFDVDGTMAETEEVHRQAFNDAFKAFGIPIEWDHEIYPELLKVSGGVERINYYLERLPPEEAAELLPRVPVLHARKSAIYSKMIDDRRARLRPGIERLIEDARSQGLRLVLVTTSSVANAEALIIANLEVRGLDYFEAIVGAQAVAQKKPAPDIYLMALSHLKLHPKDCLVFEDSENGLASARAAGLRAIVTPSKYTMGGSFDGALAVLSHLGDAFDPYEHFSGSGERDRMVTLGAVRRWIADDDDMRSLLTIGGKPVF